MTSSKFSRLALSFSKLPGRADGFGSTKLVTEPLWFEWLALDSLMLFSVWLLWAHGVGALRLRSDPTDITLVIIVLFCCATDVTLRLLAELAGHQRGQRVVVEHRPGAGGTLAMPILQQAASDGYTIAQLPQPALRTPFVQRVNRDELSEAVAVEKRNVDRLGLGVGKSL